VGDPPLVPWHRRRVLSLPAGPGGALPGASTRATVGVISGPAGAGGGRDKGEAEQKLPDSALQRYPAIFTADRLWVMGRSFPGLPRSKKMPAHRDSCAGPGHGRHHAGPHRPDQRLRRRSRLIARLEALGRTVTLEAAA